MNTLAAFAAALASRSDAQLTRLLTLRPDAMTPPVANFADLASRLCSRQSINAALDHLVLPALLALHRPSPHALVWLPALHELALVLTDGKLDGGTGRFLPLPAVRLALDAPSTPEATRPAPACKPGDMPPPVTALPPVPDVVAVSCVLRDNAAASAIESLLRTMTRLLELAHCTPLTALRDGGIGVQTMKTLSRTLDMEQTLVCFHLELAAMAGLLSLDGKARHWSATAESWSRLDRPAQWLELVQAWLGSARGVAARPLGPALPDSLPDRPASHAVSIRRTLHETVLELTGATASSPTLLAVERLLDWRHPRLGSHYRPRIPQILREMELLGITGGGAPSGPGLALGASGGTAADTAAAVTALLPAPIEHFMIQGDLTAIAPGFLARHIAARLKLMADPEGQGTASIFRFSQDSLEKGMAAGEDRESVRSFLRHHSSTALPQSLDYLIDAAATGTEATQDVPARPAQHASRCPHSVRVRQTRPATGASARPTRVVARPNAAEIAAQIACLRSQPVWGGHDGGESGPALVMEELRRAILAGADVWLRVVNSVGVVERVLVAPVSLEAGLLRSRLPGAAGMRQFSIHRIVAAETLHRSGMDIKDETGGMTWLTDP